ncbi:MAG TPA: toll/interleukin-1 receptor domain-containing protein [Rhizomicrobium sp.]
MSYRHVERDRKWARWLIEKLETFRTPRALVGRGAAARIGQLFRDDDEIAASNDLSGQIEEALRASEYLIVVCSPDTPQSRWVRKEIEFFRSLGRADRILALLVDGTPEQSFPAELVQIAQERTLPDGSRHMETVAQEPIAASVRRRSDERQRVTERRAFIQIAARLLGVAYSDLVLREKQRAARKRRIWGAAAAVTLIGTAAGGYAYWDYNALHTRYYRNIGTLWGAPFGIGEISSEEAGHRNISYAIDSVRAHVIAARRENGLHALVPLAADGIDGEVWDAGVAEWRLPYPADRAVQLDIYGSFNQIAHMSAHSLLRTENFTWQADGSAVVTFNNPAGGAEALQAADAGLARSNTSEVITRSSLIAVQRYRFSPPGFVEEKLYQTVWGGGARDSGGAFGRRYGRNPGGQVLAIWNLDARGGVLTDRRGISKLGLYYSAQGDLVRAEWRNGSGGLALNALGYAVRQMRLDTFGNRIAETYLDTMGKPIARRDWGVAAVRRRYDERGNKIEEAYFNGLGRPAERSDRGIAQTRYKFDSRGNDVDETYFDAAGRPALRKDYGIARLATHYDSAGNDIEENDFGLDGKPILNNFGFAWEEIRYNARGKIAEARFFGTDGRPILRSDAGFARQTWTYDQRGKQTEEDYFGTRGERALSKDDGAARITVRYDERGNEIEDDYFGVDGRLIRTADEGIARVTMKYDDRGNEIEEAYFGTDGKPVLRSDVAVARVVADYDDRGNKVEEDYFGIDGRPVLHKGALAVRIRYRYGPRGDLIATLRYGADGRLLAGRKF